MQSPLRGDLSIDAVSLLLHEASVDVVARDHHITLYHRLETCVQGLRFKPFRVETRSNF